MHVVVMPNVCFQCTYVNYIICAEDLAVESSPCEIRRLFAHIGQFSINNVSSAKGAFSCRSVAHLILEQKNDCFPYLKHLYCFQAMEQCLSLVLLLNCLFFGRGRNLLETFAECKSLWCALWGETNFSQWVQSHGKVYHSEKEHWSID